jgi:glycerophosphoryl diester phosphodiesterase
MEIIAHHRRPPRRGSVDPAALLRGALQSDADRVEIDVLALGSQLVAAHDPGDARRTRPLRLEDALALVAAARRDLLVDVKNASAAGPLGDAIAAAGYGSHTIASGDLTLVDIVAQRSGAARAWTLPARRSTGPTAPAGPWGLATTAARRRVERAAVAALNDGRCDAVSVDRRFVTGSLVEAVHLAGGRLLVWTVDDAVELRRFAALGVDALVTNDPALGRSR